MNIKYDNIGGIQNLTLRKIMAAAKLKEHEVSIANKLIIHQVLNFS